MNECKCKCSGYPLITFILVLFAFGNVLYRLNNLEWLNENISSLNKPVPHILVPRLED